MITPFGKELRKIRLDRDLLLKDMAMKLEFTSSYLSAIENGKKKIPNNLIETLRVCFQLTKKEVDDLREAELRSQNVIEFQVDSMEEFQKDFLVSFARRFDDIPKEVYMKMKKDVEKDS